MDRITAVVQKKEKRAVFPIVVADYCARLFNTTLAAVARDGEKLAEVISYGYHLYQYDMVLLFSDPYLEAEALGCPVCLEPIPQLLGPRRKKRGRDRRGVILKAARLLKKMVDVPVFVSIKGPFSLAAFLIGMEEFLKMLIAKEKEARETLEEALQFQIAYLRQLLSLEVNIFIGEPCASASLISPNFFAQFAQEPLTTLVKNVKEAGLLVGLHVCGETRPIMPLLDKIGCDILSIEDITQKTETVKMGGVSTKAIFFGDWEKMKKEIENAQQLNSFLILATSCDVPAETEPENIKMMIEIARALS
ncbi:MAG: uroporphyrinogen decarboxylase family protein [candidate division WOR-3 bacterium]